MRSELHIETLLHESKFLKSSSFDQHNRFSAVVNINLPTVGELLRTFVRGVHNNHPE